jgi:hypothetical protein
MSGEGDTVVQYRRAAQGVFCLGKVKKGRVKSHDKSQERDGERRQTRLQVLSCVLTWANENKAGIVVRIVIVVEDMAMLERWKRDGCRPRQQQRCAAAVSSGPNTECAFGRNAALSRRSDEDDEDGEKEADEDVDQESSSESNADADADNADVMAMRNARKSSDRNQKIAATVEGTSRECQPCTQVSDRA